MGTFDKAKDALKSELITDAVLDKAAAAAKSKLGQDKASQIDMARDFIDKKEAYSGVFKWGLHYPVTDHPRKHRKTRPIVYL